MNITRVLVWEGQHDFVKRLERCLGQHSEAEVIRYDDEVDHPSSTEAIIADIVFISTTALRRYEKNHLAWQRIEGIPVIWVGSGEQSIYATTPLSERVVLPAYFNCASLSAVLKHTMHTVTQGMAGRQQLAENAILPAELPMGKDGDFVYQSSCMHRLVGNARLYGALSVNVLIRGASGTGKEYIARLVADSHPEYRSGPFVPVNCAAIPDALFESIFFGHVRGAFTGAVRDHLGFLREAHNGTLYLDEIGDLPFYQQVKLLRALEDGVVHPVGGNEAVRTNFRLVTATNRPLVHMIREGTFRLDLYHRISVIELYIPTLQERGADEKWLLFMHGFQLALEKYSRENVASPELPGWLKDWVFSSQFSGNVRELFNRAARLAAFYLGHRNFNQGECMHLLRSGEMDCEPVENCMPPDFSSRAEERSQVLEALEKNQWRRLETADALGWSRKTLWLKMKKYGLSGQ
jgi:DNA-binding NtrC family response regulator